MITLSQFKQLKLASKRAFIEYLLAPYMDSNGKDNAEMETFLFQSSEDDLNSFFEVAADPTTRENYIKNAEKEMKKNNNAISYLKMLSDKNIIRYKETIDREEDKLSVDALINY